VNHCEVILLLFLILHILNRTLMRCLCSKISTCADRELCDSESDMPWGIQMCMDDTATSFKQVHRTQPILSYTPSILDPKNRQHHPTMTPMPEKKERKHSMAFGLPREKGSILTPSSNEGRNDTPLMAPSIGESRINLSYGLKVGSVAVDAMK